jgi:hypothetical protein
MIAPYGDDQADQNNKGNNSERGLTVLAGVSE